MSTDHRWTFSTLGCPDLSLEEVCALAARWGFSALELRCLQGRIDLPDLFAEVYGTPERLAQTLAAHGLRVQLLDTSLALIQPDPAHRDEFLRFVPWAEALQVPFLRVFDGGEHGQAPSAAQLAEAVETVCWWQELRHRAGWRVDIVMETHTACITQSACLDLQWQLAEPIALLWDAHHTWRAGEPLLETWRALAPYVRHVHVKDSVTDPSVTRGFGYVLPGLGEFPWDQLQDAWRQVAYDGIVSLEWEKKWHPTLPPLEEALAAARTACWF